SVAVVFGLAGLSKPRWLSLICTKLKSLAGAAASAAPISRERGMPPAIDQTMAVPAQVMHFKTLRRSVPPGCVVPFMVIPAAPGPTAGPVAAKTGGRRGVFPSGAEFCRE